MKVKRVKTKKTIAKSNWAEDDLSDAAGNDVEMVKKQKKSKKLDDSVPKVVKKVKKFPSASEASAKKVVKSDKIKKKKKAKQPANENSDDEDKEYDASLDKLKEIDPEFYKFLEQNDKKLLKFNPDVDEDTNANEHDESDKEDDANGNEDDGSDDDVDDEEEEKVHKPLAELDVASDESDFEDENNTARKENSVTLRLLKQWQSELAQDRVPLETMKSVILALNSTLATLAGETDASVKAYQVEGVAAFNGVIQLCVLHLEPAVRRFLGLHKKTALQPHKCKKWNKVKSSLRGYFTDITKLLEQVSSANILVILLKHIHQSIPMIMSFTSLLKPILKRLVTIWSTGEETVRVLAFLCILRITRSQPMTVLSTVLKAMYLSFVRNSKFVSPNTLPAINFMRRSLSEMFALDLNLSYQHVFLYIRQLAIHLRNALTLKKKESYQAVYNWQFINSIRLWSELLATTSDKAQLQPLIYPLVSIITGTIKLIPTAQYFPLRFHCVRALIQLSKETRTFIPVMPFILEVLKSNTFNQRHTKVSMKPISFNCILRLNQNQMQESGFRDEVIENIVGCTLEYMAHESYTVSYPDMVVPAIIELKHYLKHGKNINANYRSKLKTLVDKLAENARCVTAEREKFTFDLHDTASINAWETQLRNNGTPLLAFYENWFNTNLAVQQRRATKSEDLDEYNLPKVLKRHATNGTADKSDGPVDLFPSDDDEEQLDVEKAPKAKKSKKQKTMQSKPTTEPTAADDSDNEQFVDDGIDIVKDLDLDDW